MVVLWFSQLTYSRWISLAGYPVFVLESCGTYCRGSKCILWGLLCYQIFGKSSQSILEDMSRHLTASIDKGNSWAWSFPLNGHRPSLRALDAKQMSSYRLAAQHRSSLLWILCGPEHQTATALYSCTLDLEPGVFNVWKEAEVLQIDWFDAAGHRILGQRFSFSFPFCIHGARSPGLERNADEEFATCFF